MEEGDEGGGGGECNGKIVGGGHEEGGDESLKGSVGSKGSSKRTPSLLNLFIPISQGDSSTRSPYSTITSWTTGFLRSRREKKKEKKEKKKNKKENEENKSETEEKDDGGSGGVGRKKSVLVGGSSGEVDEEGYSVRPSSSFGQTENKTNFYSSSDSDSDDERDKRLRVEIKPLTNGGVTLSASVDELRTTVENMTLSPLGISRKLVGDGESSGNMKRSQSVSQRIGNSSPLPFHSYTPLHPPPLPNHPNTHPHNTKQPHPLPPPPHRYSDLADLFNEVGEMVPNPVSGGGRSSNYRNTPTPTSSIPRPPSRPRPDRSLNSASPAILRADSIASLPTNPSPLTLGFSDSIPLAVAFHEIIHAGFRGADESMCQVRMSGSLMVSFPSGIFEIFNSLPSPPILSFNLRSSQNSHLLHISPHSNLLSLEREEDGVYRFEMKMSALVDELREEMRKKPSQPYFNLNILKYQIERGEGASSCPLHLVSFWKSDEFNTDLRIDYKYNSHAFRNSNSKCSPLSQLSISASLSGNIKNIISKPNAQWNGSTNRAVWKLAPLSSSSENNGVGSLRARFETTGAQAEGGTIVAQFSCENETLSGAEFELIGTSYRLSLLKKSFVSGKYSCEGEMRSSSSSIPSSPLPPPLHPPPHLLNNSSTTTLPPLHTISPSLLNSSSLTSNVTTSNLPTTNLPTSNLLSSNSLTSNVTTSNLPTSNTPTSNLLTSNLLSSNSLTSNVTTSNSSISNVSTSNILSNVSSRDGSSLPIGVGVHEIIHTQFRGNDESRCQVGLGGTLSLSFPAGLLGHLVNSPSPPALRFKLRTGGDLCQVTPLPRLLLLREEKEREVSCEFEMSALIELLKKQSGENPSASYFNIDILKYHIQSGEGASSCPLHLVSFWKCEGNVSDLRVDYKYNSHAFPHSSSPSLTSLPSLLNVSISAPLSTPLLHMQSKPNAIWHPNTNCGVWKLPKLSLESEGNGIGSLRARFTLANGPSTPGVISAQFNCENATLSGAEFELIGPGYRVSLFKKGFVSGKYTCDAETSFHRYAVLPDKIPEN